MVIECPECSTKFRVSAEKIPAQGAKLRCARCRHIFVVKPEEEALASPAVEIPISTPAPVEEPPAAPEPAAEAPEAAADESAFSFDEPSAESDFAEEPAAAGMDDPFGDTDFGFDETPEEAPAAEDVFGSEETETESGNIDFGFEDDTASTTETNTEETPSDEFGFDTPEESETPEIGAGVDDEFDMSAFEDEASATDDAFSFDEDYGNVEIGSDAEEDEQPFSFGEEPTTPDEPATAPEPSREEFPVEEPVEETPYPEEIPEEPTAEPFPPVGEETFTESIPAAPPAKKRGPFSILILFLLILIIGILIAGGVLYWQSGPEGLMKMYQRITGQQVTAPVKGQILVKNLQGSFMTNKSAGELLVIQGDAVNDYRESRAAIQVKGVLFDSQGKQLRQKTIFCGNPISQEDLRSLPYDKLEEIMGNQFGESLVNLNVTPGQVIPFTIVFRDIPDNLSEFVVEVAGSNPAAQ